MTQHPKTLSDLHGLLKAWHRRVPCPAAAALPVLLLMTDEARTPDPVAAIRRLPRGSAVVFRHYGAAGRAGLARAGLARALVAAAKRRGVSVLIAGDARLAAATGASGLHLPEHMARRGPGPWRAWLKKGAIITAAAHSPGAICRAMRAGADAVLLAPVFATASHPGRLALGPLRFARFARASPLPVFALGGITAENWRRLAASGAAGLAGIGGFFADAAKDANGRAARGGGS